MSKDQIILEISNGCLNGQIDRVKQLVNSKYSDSIPPNIASMIDEVLKPQLLVATFLHDCVTNYNIQDSIPSKAILDAKIELLKFFITFDNPILNLNIIDANGLAIIHLAVINRDDLFLTTLIDETMKLSINNRLDINLECAALNWTAIQYAVNKSNLNAFRLLLKAGSQIIPKDFKSIENKSDIILLKMAKKALSNEKNSNSKAFYENSQKILSELNEELESKVTNSFAKVTSLEIPEEKPQETDLMDLVEFYEKTVSKQKTTTSKVVNKKEVPNPSNSQNDNSTTTKTTTMDKKKKKGEKEKSTPSKSNNNNNKGANNNNKVSPLAYSSGSSIKNNTMLPINELSIASRDEVMDRLLAMGFKESDCLSSISLYGTDVDRAISWLCERPASSEEDNKPILKEDVVVSKTNPKASTTNQTSTSATSPAPPVLDAQAKLQKEKEELRRINRAWNAKAEDEKKKVILILLIITMKIKNNNNSDKKLHLL